jgi:uncharacterized HAD superfamily protein
MNYKTFNDLSNDIKKNAHKFQGAGYDLVVGIPRSGMIPAYMIALTLNKACTDLKSLVEDRTLQKGSRPLGNPIERPSDAKKILLVDDSILGGVSLQEALSKIPEHLKEKITTLAVYSSKRSRDDVDIFLAYVPMPRVFEWNVFHHGVIGDACVDIDGVLCLDPSHEQNDDGDVYKDFLLNAKPFILPTGKINTLVTNRLEKYRPETEAWLRKHNIEFDTLVMLDLPSAKERQRLGRHAQHKADYYKNSTHRLFIESEPGQAKKIAKLAQKPVFCVENNIMYMPSLAVRLSKNPDKIWAYLKSYSPLIPTPAKFILRPLYRLIRKSSYAFRMKMAK